MKKILGIVCMVLLIIPVIKAKDDFGLESE